MRPSRQPDHLVSRRSVLKASLFSAAALGGPSVLSGCALGLPAAAFAGPPRHGGELRAGIVGGGSKDTLDAHLPVTHPDQARVFALYDTLMERDADFRLRPALARSLTVSADARSWLLRLRKGVTFHDGRPLTVDDVIYTFRRILDPKAKRNQATALAVIDAARLRRIDAHTLRIHLKEPSVLLADLLANYDVGIVPVGYDPRKPVGTGPFTFTSFTPGQRSVFDRDPNHWRHGRPYLDRLTIVDFPDDSARVNALLAGQVDVIDQVPLGQVKVLRTNPTVRLLQSHTGAWVPFTMRVDAAPFHDVRVRQALRLVADRDQLVRQVLAGHGRVANDLFAPFDPMYARDLPQRRADPEQARALLRRAGHPDLRVELVTSPVAAGTVEAAEVFARQARTAGVTVRIRKVDPGVYFGADYTHWPFAQDYWFTRDYLPQVTQSMLPGSPFNETHWRDPRHTDLVNAALGTLDETRRRRLVQEAQHIEYDSGGYLIWGFADQVDAHSVRVGGLVPDRSAVPLSGYRFHQLWVAS